MSNSKQFFNIIVETLFRKGLLNLSTLNDERKDELFELCEYLIVKIEIEDSNVKNAVRYKSFRRWRLLMQLKIKSMNPKMMILIGIKKSNISFRCSKLMMQLKKNSPCQTIRSVHDAILLCQRFLGNTDRLLNSAVHKRQNYDQIRTVVSID